MSYESKAGTNSNTASFYPTTPMYLDIAALQIMYGRDTQTNNGNNVYTFQQGQRYWQTIYDAGGTDTIVYKGSANCTIDLRIGYFSNLSDAISLSDGSLVRNTVCIGPSTNIERATGGNGNDKLTGGSGKDFFDFKGALASSNVDTIMDFNVASDTIRLDNANFSRLTKTGDLSASLFHIGSKAHDSNDRIIYNKSNGDLIYDTNGSGAGGAIVFAHLDRGLSLTKADFIVI